jgi:hypothetical protein
MAKAAKADSGKTYTLSLTRNDRLGISRYLPERGTILTMLVAKQVQEKCALSEAEQKEINLRPDRRVVDGKETVTIVGDAAALGKAKSVTFTESEFGLLTSQVDHLDSEKKIELGDLGFVGKVREAKGDAT